MNVIDAAKDTTMIRSNFMKRTKAWRRWKDHCISIKRVKDFKAELNANDYYKIRELEPHRLVKTHPFDCGNPRCYLCHGEKLMNEVSHSDKRRSKVVIAEEYEIQNN